MITVRTIAALPVHLLVMVAYGAIIILGWMIRLIEGDAR